MRPQVCFQMRALPVGLIAARERAPVHFLGRGPGLCFRRGGRGTEPAVLGDIRDRVLLDGVQVLDHAADHVLSRALVRRQVQQTLGGTELRGADPAQHEVRHIRTGLHRMIFGVSYYSLFLFKKYSSDPTAFGADFLMAISVGNV